MRNSEFKLASILIALIFVCGVTYAISGEQSDVGSSQQHKSKSESDNLPVVDYIPSQPDSLSKQSIRQQNIRYIRNARYDGYPGIIQEGSAGDETILNTHSVGKFPPIPSLESDVVIIGEVSGAHAFLSNDKSFVYSEYTVRIEEVLKGANRHGVSPSELVTIERLGGAVRFPSGRIRKYRESEYGVPLNGHKYIFFLKHEDVGQTFSLLTAYELTNGRALALDHMGRFARYKDVPAEIVLNAVRESVKGGQSQ